MVKNKQQLLTNIFIPLILLLFGAGLLLQYFFYTDFSFTVLSYLHPSNTIKDLNNDALLAKKVINGEFTGKDNFLGLVSIRFATFDRENDDIIIFRLKEKGSKKWYFTENYRTTFANNEFYNFGFVPIPDSSGKQYQFEIESTRGKEGNAIAISQEEPIFMTKYQYPKSILLANKKLLVTHALKKVLFLLFNNETVFALSIFFLPLVYYLLGQKRRIKKLLNNKYLFPGLITMLALWNIFFTSRIIDSTLLVIIGLLLLHFWKKRDDILVALGIFFLLLGVGLYNIRYEDSIRAMSWFLILFLVYVVLSIKRT